MTANLRGLYAVTPDDELLPRLSALVEAALRGGVRLVQYRNKTAAAALKRAQSADLLRLCRAYDARLLINDDVALALAIGADGVHLGRDDGELAGARAALGYGRILGVSCYGDLACAEAAYAAGADYIAFGSMYASRTKPQAVIASHALLGQAKRQFGLPVAGIGGITIDNAPELIDAGADLLAVITDLFDATDIVARAQEYERLFAAAIP
jgi:thiamine-phosphate pyrophosphorylase